MWEVMIVQCRRYTDMPGAARSILRSHNVAPDTPLADAFTPVREDPVLVTPLIITPALRDSVRYLFPSRSFLPDDVSARHLRTADANALLCARVDIDVIRLLG